LIGLSDCERMDFGLAGSGWNSGIAEGELDLPNYPDPSVAGALDRGPEQLAGRRVGTADILGDLRFLLALAGAGSEHSCLGFVAMVLWTGRVRLREE
jgi:hypothetical protein